MAGIDWQFTLALVMNGIMIGLMYALIALGFVLIYKATDAINFAQGEFVMFAAFIAAGAGDLGGLPFWPSALLAVLGMVVLGFGIERVVLRPMIGRPVISVIMATIGLAAVLRGFATLVVRRRNPGDQHAGRRLPDPARAGQPAAGAAGRRRGQPGFSRRLQLVLSEEPGRGGDARGRRQPAGGDGDGDQRAALFRARLGDGRGGLGLGRHRLGGDARRRQPAGAGRPQGVSGGDPGRSRFDHRRDRRRADRRRRREPGGRLSRPLCRWRHQGFRALCADDRGA